MHNKRIDAGNYCDKFIFWIKSFGFSQDSFISFIIKSDEYRKSRITLKDDAGLTLDLSFVLSGDNKYERFFILLTEIFHQLIISGEKENVVKKVYRSLIKINNERTETIFC